MRILIAEDDRTSRMLLAAVLRNLGHEVVETCNGEQTWAELETEDAPRLALLDWMMPGATGLEVLRRLRELERLGGKTRPTYVILLTTLDDKEHLAQGLDAGADDFLTKPFHPLELRARIDVGRRVDALYGRLVEVASTDELTGALNRRAGLAALDAELNRADREGHGVGVGIVDADHFKRINDTYGHLVGDEVLRELVRRFRDSLRPYDVLSRLGGEEFLVVAPGTPDVGLWERLLRAVAATPFDTSKGALEVTVSIGYTSGRGLGDALLSAADSALYRAKAAGRNRVVSQD